MGRWITLAGVPLLVAALIGAVLWRWLPRWAPEWTVRHAPWVDLAARAALVQGRGWGGSYGVGFGWRVRDWGLSAVPALHRCLA
ncbi:MAG: hypothetical protein H0W72_17145, partial [Planctomycetes bacterium]|nr:hypothetical protein [Planctomycetota bacterium]